MPAQPIASPLFLRAAPLTSGAAVTSLGTTLAAKLHEPKPLDAPDLWLYSHKLGEQWMAGGASIPVAEF